MKKSRRKTSNVCDHRRVCWSKLPGKIIFKISKHLKTRNDVVALKQVCSKWRKRSLEPPRSLLSFNVPLPNTIKQYSDVLPFHNLVGPLVLHTSDVYLITRENDDQCSRPFMIMAEELKAGTVSVRHPLTAKRVKDLVPSLDLTHFKLLKLAQGYCFKSSNCVHKVLLCASSEFSVDFLVLYYKGNLGKLSLNACADSDDDDDDDDDDVVMDENEEDEDVKLRYIWKRFKVGRGNVYRFRYLDDVALFRGEYYVVDRRGKLYVIDTESMSAENTRVIVSEPICRGDMPCYRKKRLVVDEATNELHLVVRENAQDSLKTRFKVYKFNEHDKRWDVVMKIGRGRVLFVGIDHCFFSAARHFDGCGGNCIVFAANCFTQYNGCDAPDRRLFGGKRDEVGVYRMGEGDNFRLLSSALPEFAQIFWPPPAWLSTSVKEETEGTHENESSDKSSDEESDSSFVSLSDKHVRRPSRENESSSDEDADDDIIEILSDSSDKDDEDCDEDADEDVEMESDGSGAADSNTSSKSEKSDSRFKASDASFSAQEQPVKRELTDDQTSEDDSAEEKVVGASSIPRTPTTPSFSSARGRSSTDNLQGLDIRPDLLPTLRRIWADHGNIINEHTFRSKKMQKCSLEELAELKMTLDNTTARSLTKSQIEEMTSTLSDIKRAGLKVDWLEPAVKKAAAVEKSRPYIEKIAAVDKKTAKLEKQKSKFLAQYMKVKQELDDTRDDLRKKIPFPEDEIIDLDACLGDGY